MCKRIGALWDVEKKKWYAPDTLDREAFKRWWPKGVEQNKKSQNRAQNKREERRHS